MCHTAHTAFRAAAMHVGLISCTRCVVKDAVNVESMMMVVARKRNVGVAVRLKKRFDGVTSDRRFRIAGSKEF